MGDIADMMLDGTLCECCGVYIPGEAPGHPRYCSAQCRADRTPAVRPSAAANIAANKQLHAEQKKIKCTVCGKRVKTVGMSNHMKDAHP